MTVIVKIEPVLIKLDNGWEATVTGIDLFSGDPYNGDAYHQHSGDRKKVRWTHEGKARDNDGTCNLNMDVIDMKNVEKAAKLLGAKMYP